LPLKINATTDLSLGVDVHANITKQKMNEAAYVSVFLIIVFSPDRFLFRISGKNGGRLSEIASALCAVAANAPHIGLHLCHGKAFRKGVRTLEHIVGDVRIVEDVENFAAFFAFKMDVRSYVRVVAEFIVFDFERMHELFFFE